VLEALEILTVTYDLLFYTVLTFLLLFFEPFLYCMSNNNILGSIQKLHNLIDN